MKTPLYFLNLPETTFFCLPLLLDIIFNLIAVVMQFVCFPSYQADWPNSLTFVLFSYRLVVDILLAACIN